MADRKSDESNTTSHDDIVAFTAKVHLAGLSISTLGHAVFGFGDKRLMAAYTTCEIRFTHL